jgi:hypothetical protein
MNIIVFSSYNLSGYSLKPIMDFAFDKLKCYKMPHLGFLPRSYVEEPIDNISLLDSFKENIYNF